MTTSSTMLVGQLATPRAAVREAWGRLQAATARDLSDADACMMEREAEVDDLFQQAVPLGNNTVPTDGLKDAVPDAELSLRAVNVVTGSYDRPRSVKSTVLEFKTMRYEVKYTAIGVHSHRGALGEPPGLTTSPYSQEISSGS
eukprot:jgi/Tetstr1/448944/TSEL_036170.t1